VREGLGAHCAGQREKGMTGRRREEEKKGRPQQNGKQRPTNEQEGSLTGTEEMGSHYWTGPAWSKREKEGRREGKMRMDWAAEGYWG